MAEGGSRQHRSLPLALAFAVVAAAAGVAGCTAGSGGEPGGACPAPTTAPPSETALMPTGLSFDQIGTVTRVVNAAGHLTVRAVSTKPIDELTVLIQDAVTAAGYRPAGMDNEGFEAEVFFTYGAYAAGQALVRRGECDGRWDVELVLIDPSAVPSSTAPPTSRADPT